jgi:hypothetical protein
MKILGTAMQKVRAGTAANEDQIIDALRHLPVGKVVDLVPDQPWFDAQGEIEDELFKELVASGQRTGSSFPKIRKQVLTYRFDADRPEAAAWAKKESAQLVTEIIEDQRNTIKDFVSASQMGDFTVTQVARNLRDVVGLTTQQTGWVDNFRNRAISDRMANGETFEQASQRAAKETERYQQRIHRYRSETIARTEILRASSEGRNQAWQQGIAEGYISPDSMKQWSVEFDACEICSPLDGETVGISAEFPDGDPPLHPNCRCTLDLVDIDVSDFEDMSWEEIDAELDSLFGEQENTPASSVDIQIMPEGLSRQERFEWIQSNVDNTLNLGKGNIVAQSAYDSYTNQGYITFNNTLRNGLDSIQVTNPSRVASEIVTLRDSIMSSKPLENPIRVWRGIKGTGSYADELLALGPGTTINEPGFMSTTARPETGFDFGGRRGIVMEITVPRGGHAIAGVMGESEIILPPSTSLRLTGQRTELVDGIERRVLQFEVEI